MNYIQTGDSALFIRFEERISPDINDRVTSLSQFIEANPFNGLIEVIPSYSGVTVLYDPVMVTPEEIIEQLRNYKSDNRKGSAVKRITVPVLYGGEHGPDLGVVAKHNSLSEEEVIRKHTDALYRIYMMGFTPGFPYLGGMPKEISMPRRREPRLVIPEGSVAIAGNQTGIYPMKSPGGWQIIGKTPIPLFDPDSKDPFLLSAGMELQFRIIDNNEFHDILSRVKVKGYIPEISSREL